MSTHPEISPRHVDEQLAHVTKQLKQLKHFVKQLGRVETGEIRLLEAHCKVGDLLTEKLPDNATQALNLDVTVDAKTSAILVIATYSLTATYEPADKIDENAPLFIRGRFLLHYPCTREGGAKKLAESIQPNAARDSWHDWKDLVQSLTMRMGMPPFPVPRVDLNAVVQSGPPKPTRARREPRT